MSVSRITELNEVDLISPSHPPAVSRHGRPCLGGWPETWLPGHAHQRGVHHRAAARAGDDHHVRQEGPPDHRAHHPPGGHQYQKGQEEAGAFPRAPGWEALPASLEREREGEEAAVIF